MGRIPWRGPEGMLKGLDFTVLWRDDSASEKGVAAEKARQEKCSGVRMRKQVDLMSGSKENL